MRTMKIANHGGQGEIFLSVQGEGVSQGVASVFVRASLCNLHCVWCDTDYTWNWQGTPFAHERDREPGYAKFEKVAEIIEMPTDRIAAAVQAFDCKNVILTGGEPLLQQAGFIEVMEQLRDADGGYRFEVETNGTLLPCDAFDELVNQYNVSPKLSNAGMGVLMRIHPDALHFFAKSAKAYFKFVVDTQSDIDEVLAIVGEYDVEPGRVYLMPQGRTSVALIERREWVKSLCTMHHFAFSDRLHVHAFGDRRGV